MRTAVFDKDLRILGYLDHAETSDGNMQVIAYRIQRKKSDQFGLEDINCTVSNTIFTWSVIRVSRDDAIVYCAKVLVTDATTEALNETNGFKYWAEVHGELLRREF